MNISRFGQGFHGGHELRAAFYEQGFNCTGMSAAGGLAHLIENILPRLR